MSFQLSRRLCVVQKRHVTHELAATMTFAEESSRGYVMARVSCMFERSAYCSLMPLAPKINLVLFCPRLSVCIVLQHMLRSAYVVLAAVNCSDGACIQWATTCRCDHVLGGGAWLSLGHAKGNLFVSHLLVNSMCVGRRVFGLLTNTHAAYSDRHVMFIALCYVVAFCSFWYAASQCVPLEASLQGVKG